MINFYSTINIILNFNRKVKEMLQKGHLNQNTEKIYGIKKQKGI